MTSEGTRQVSDRSVHSFRQWQQMRAEQEESSPACDDGGRRERETQSYAGCQQIHLTRTLGVAVLVLLLVVHAAPTIIRQDSFAAKYYITIEIPSVIQLEANRWINNLQQASDYMYCKIVGGLDILSRLFASIGVNLGQKEELSSKSRDSYASNFAPHQCHACGALKDVGTDGNSDSSNTCRSKGARRPRLTSRDQRKFCRARGNWFLAAARLGRRLRFIRRTEDGTDQDVRLPITWVRAVGAVVEHVAKMVDTAESYWTYLVDNVLAIGGEVYWRLLTGHTGDQSGVKRY